jgi:hypothetical protein
MIIGAVALAGMMAPAAAGAVVYTQSQAQTSAGQVFTYTFSGLVTPGAAGSITIGGRGDYTLGFPDEEFLTYDVEGLLAGSLAPDNAQSNTNFGFNDNAFQSTFVLSLAQLQLLTADGSITITLDLSNGVNLFDPATASTFVTLDIPAATNAVPEPATWAMMMLGFGGVGFAMRRKSKVNTRIRFA